MITIFLEGLRSMSFFDIVSLILISLGTSLILIASFGVVRMPDLYMRMSASTKAVTLGVGFVLLAAAIHFYELGLFSRIFAIIIFLLATAPVSAHRIGRAAYMNGVPLWENSLHDDLKERYNAKTGVLTGLEEAPKPPNEASLL